MKGYTRVRETPESGFEKQSALTTGCGKLMLQSVHQFLPLGGLRARLFFSEVL